MGKLIRSRTDYSDLHHRILKTRKKKGNKHETPENQLKRKILGSSEEEPPSKTPKLCTEDNTKESFDFGKNADKNVSDMVIVENSEFLHLKMKDIQVNDLFNNDELKNCYMQYTNKDIYALISEEIGLEGLDGITLEGKYLFRNCCFHCNA